ncbi:MAG: hypothetical protein ABJF04_05525 [Reichenbachiella sp.]|uniref:hypothetical protein n=1 Tax=Reichenbachiella sp. TaxID=2184521 RepID=UPI003266B8A3
MHNIEPYSGWLKYYDSASDALSPFHGKEYNYDLYSETIYGYYIDPAWDYIGSETLYAKILFTDYELGFAVFEFIGEWNDAVNNDIMYLKRNVIDEIQLEGINKYILIGENVLNFHGSDDSYYEEWFEDVEEGWIVGIGFRDFVVEEMTNFNVDGFINFGGPLDIHNWRTLKPLTLCQQMDRLIMKRLGM